MVAATNNLNQFLKTRSRLACTQAEVGFDVASTTILGSTGYKLLGASNAGSTKVDLPKGIYDTATGSPVTTKFSDVTEWSGKISTDLFEYNSLIIEEKIGTQLTTSVVAATTSFYAGTVAASGSSFINNGANLLVSLSFGATIALSLFIGDSVSFVLGTTGINGGTWIETQKIIDRDTTNNTITCQGYTTDVPPAASVVQKNIFENNYIGGSELQTKKFRLVTSLRDGDVFVLFCNKGVSDEGFNPNQGDGKSAMMFPYNFKAFGTAQTIPGFDLDQVIIANHTTVRVVKTS